MSIHQSPLRPGSASKGGPTTPRRPASPGGSGAAAAGSSFDRAGSIKQTLAQARASVNSFDSSKAAKPVIKPLPTSGSGSGASLIDPSRPFTPGPALIRRGSLNFLSAETPRGSSASSTATALPPAVAAAPNTARRAAALPPAATAIPNTNSTALNSGPLSARGRAPIATIPISTTAKGVPISAGNAAVPASGGEEWPVFQTEEDWTGDDDDDATATAAGPAGVRRVASNDSVTTEQGDGANATAAAAADNDVVMDEGGDDDADDGADGDAANPENEVLFFDAGTAATGPKIVAAPATATAATTAAPVAATTAASSAAASPVSPSRHAHAYKPKPPLTLLHRKQQQKQQSKGGSTPPSAGTSAPSTADTKTKPVSVPSVAASPAPSAPATPIKPVVIVTAPATPNAKPAVVHAKAPSAVDPPAAPLTLNEWEAKCLEFVADNNGAAVAPASETATLISLYESAKERLQALITARAKPAAAGGGGGSALAAAIAVFGAPDTSVQDLARVCAVILRLPVLTTYSKVSYQCVQTVFELSKDNTHDSLFLPGNTNAAVAANTAATAALPKWRGVLLEPLLLCLQQSVARGFHDISFVLATIRNLSGEPINQRILAERGAVKSLGSLLAADVYDRDLKLPDGSSKLKLLMEVTGVLRNLADTPQPQRWFDSTTVHSLLAILPRWFQDTSLLLNVTRIVSKLSLSQTCRAMLNAEPPAPPTASSTSAGTPQQPSTIQTLTKILAVHHTKLALCIRVCFILGNMTVTNDSNRVRIAVTADGTKVLISLLARNVERDRKLQELKKSTAGVTGSSASVSVTSGGSTADAGKQMESKVDRLQLKKRALMDREMEDMLVKSIRLIANLSINKMVGMGFAVEPNIALLVQLLETKSLSKSEELALNVLSAITNLSFYQQFQTASGVVNLNVLFAESHQRTILAVLCRHLFSPNVEVVLEVVRALGNFSRVDTFRTQMHAARVDETLLLLLDHSSDAVVYGVCGVLLNCASNPSDASAIFCSNKFDGWIRVLGVIDRFGVDDCSLSSLACKTLINICMCVPDEVLPNALIEEVVELTQPIIAAIKAEAESDSAADSKDGAALSPERHELLTVAEQLQVLIVRMPTTATSSTRPSTTKSSRPTTTASTSTSTGTNTAADELEPLPAPSGAEGE